MMQSAQTNTASGQKLKAAAPPAAAPIHPAALIALIKEADGTQRDFMIQQAIMSNQVPPYMFPDLLEDMKNDDLRDQLKIYLMSAATSSQMPTTPRAAHRNQAAGPGSAANHQTMAQILMLLENMDNGELRDAYVAKMIMENS